MMSKIEPSLMNKIKENPSNEFNVIVVQNDSAARIQLENKGLNRIMDDIHTGSLKGDEIIKMSKLKSVKGIEENNEMGII